VLVGPAPAASGDAGATDVETPGEAASNGDGDAPSSDRSSDDLYGPSKEWQELYAAMQSGDYELAADRLLASMTPGDDGKIPIPLWQVLECVLGLFEQGKGRRARELLDGFDGWNERQGLHPGQVGAQAAARWQLSKELAALSGRVDRQLVVRLAKDVKSGEFFRSRDLLEREQKTDPTLRDRMQRHAPTLFAAARPNAAEIRMRRMFRTDNPWNYAWLVFVAFQCVRWITKSESSETKTEVVAQSRRPAERKSDEAALHVPPVEQPGYWRRINVERAIDESVQKGACNEVREQWPRYIETLRGADQGSAGDEGYSTRRLAALAMCPELDKELPKRP
jgi:hypothetical protein